MLLALLACTCAGTTAAPPAPDASEAPQTPEAPLVSAAPKLTTAQKALCDTPLACGLLAHYAVDTVEAHACEWCGEDRPGLCGSTWLPAAAGADVPRCSIYLELERCILQHSGTSRFADLPEMAKANVLALQDRADGGTDCVGGAE